MIGTVTGSEIKKNADGDQDVLLLQVEITDPDDVQTVELYTQAGEDYNPPNDSRVFLLQIGDAWKIAIACDDRIVPDVEQGERKLYSSDGGEIKAYIKLVKDGNIEINGDDDNAVRYAKLEEAFNQLRDDFNSLVSDYNAHIHITTATVGIGPVGTISPTTSQGNPSTSDISPAKIDNIKVPS